jgi:hypothetical protein
MRKAMLLLAVLGCVGLLWAADPSVGMWKANMAKSKNPPAKELTMMVREVGEQIELTEKRIRPDGKSSLLKCTYPQQGGILKYQEGAPAGQTAVITVIDPSDWYDTHIQNGKQVLLLHFVISKDGKTMRIISKRTDEKGKPVEGLLVLEKQ